jgi:hypothetical protein
LAHFQLIEQPRKPNQKDAELQFRPVQSKGSRQTLDFWTAAE